MVSDLLKREVFVDSKPDDLLPVRRQIFDRLAELLGGFIGDEVFEMVRGRGVGERGGLLFEDSLGGGLIAPMACGLICSDPKQPCSASDPRDLVSLLNRLDKDRLQAILDIGFLSESAAQEGAKRRLGFQENPLPRSVGVLAFRVVGSLRAHSSVVTLNKMRHADRLFHVRQNFSEKLFPAFDNRVLLAWRDGDVVPLGDKVFLVPRGLFGDDK